jgi:hypothetical protein
MKIFYTGTDIEELAASGVTRLELTPGVMITDVARELAEELGIELVKPDDSSATIASASAPVIQSPIPNNVEAKPRGCQHGPLPANAIPPASVTNLPDSPDGVVNRLVNVVTRLTDRGG